MIKIFVFVLGAIIGSFLNVCIYRLPRGESIVMPPSSCPNCKRNILWYDNIPVVSYLLLGARCRFCKARISFRYFLVEVLTAIFLVLLYAAFKEDMARFYAYSVLGCCLIVATFVDFEINEIPDEVSIGGLVVGLVLSFAFPSIFAGGMSNLSSLRESAIGALAGGASIYLMGFFGELVFKKEAMGGGDVKLMAMIGAFLGWRLVIFTFFLAPLFGSIVGLILKIRDGREIIPYGPYLSLAAIVAIFFGNRILGTFFLI